MPNRNTILVFLIPIIIILSGCTAKNNPLTQDNLTGTWQVIEIGMDNQIKQTYDINIIQTGEVIKFFKGTTELGHGHLYNQTISVTTQNATEWNGFGILLISIVNNTVMRAVPDTSAFKWMDFQRIL